ncbi:MAG: tail fiber domain-containing protein [Prevotella sp.]|nr:tail fiber domain-containing protein [Prevotella sp.]
MKKIFLLSIAVIICSTISAQLNVESTGKVNVQSAGNQLPTMFAVGPSMNIYNDHKLASAVHIRPNTIARTVGIYCKACAVDAQTFSRSFGTYSVGGNATSGYNYGVVGTIDGTNYGAGIYGSSINVTGYVPGLYAGYFNGETYVNGTLTATNVITPSDVRLKTNITNISNTDQTLDNLMKVNVLSYNYKKQEVPEAERDTIQEATLMALNKKWESDAKERHFGFSAQEIQELYPDLVKEGQDGFLGVNYVEMVPLLLRCIQELKQELDIIKGETKTMTRSIGDEATDFSNIAKDNVLYQNTPNPFKEQTVIRFKLADNIQNASICIFDMNGRLLKKIPVSSEMDRISIGSYEFGEGIFLYSLIVNGQEVDTKKMIITS